MTPPHTPPNSLSFTRFLTQHWQKLLGAVIWLAVIGAYALYARAHDLTPVAAVQTLANTISGTVYGPLIYILIYALRPLLFFPATLLTIAGGFLFGTVLGVLYTVIGSNASAMVAYLVGRWFGNGVLDSESSTGVMQRYTERLRQHSFATVLTMRLIFLPYDLVSYVCGFLRIDWRAFLLATALGSIPGTISFVSFGASIEGTLTDFVPRIDPWTLGLGVVMFAISLVLSRYFRRREARQM